MKEAEDRLQSQMYIWFHNTYPNLRGLLCYNFNNSRNLIEGNKNKAMGLQAGRSDLVFYYDSKAYMIEVKVEKGKQSQAQIDWELLITEQGFNYSIVRNLAEFQTVIKSILS